jgi:hypothetical protein
MKAMVKAAFISVLAALGLLAACSPFGGATVFNCDNEAQCAPDGRCVNNVCAFPASDCASGYKYGEHSGMPGVCVGNETMPDAAIDAPTMCVAGTKTCFQHAVETCRADGMGFDPVMREPCALTCDTGTNACVGTASNILLTDQRTCNADGMALALTPAATATITIDANDITCAPACNNGGTTTIPRTATTPNSFYCLSALNLPAGLTVNVTAGITSGITLFSHGAAVINANITFDGGDATGVTDNNANNDLFGPGGPGGFPGGAIANNDADGNPGGGAGTCGGRGGQSVGGAAQAAGGGGGGGGNKGTGGIGGDGRTSVATNAPGGPGGVNQSPACGTDDVRPLLGGSGGGGGGDGACGAGNPCAWPGGGGGGALHIVSRASIMGSGTISVSGGDGFGANNAAFGVGGGGGGGAGGSILLEAPMVMFTGMLLANGGNGGVSASGLGGTGATGANVNGGDGADSGGVNDRGGSGAGGAGGRIRINATAGASCATASPAASCTMSTLRTAP